jgi:hypothetical protein
LTAIVLFLAMAASSMPAGNFTAEDLLRADLDLDTLGEQSAEGIDALALLDGFLEDGTAYRFDAGRLVAWTDPRWYAVASTSPSEDGIQPFLEIRRWPGDTVLAFYALPAEAGSPEVPGVVWGDAVDRVPDWSVLEGTLLVDGRERRVLWAEKVVGGDLGVCGAMLLPGDAGLGARSQDYREDELIAILRRVDLDDEGWRSSGPPSGGVPLAPNVHGAPGLAREKTDPWQTVAGQGYTLGLPPGLLARRLDSGPTAASAVRDGSLWFRGRFVDRDGIEVRVGDGRRAGYVATIRGGLDSWREGGRPPLGSPTAVQKDRLPLEQIAVEGTRARSGWASSWTEPGFPGEWLVFGLEFEGEAVEIGIPVLTGNRSLALFWIPVTWREEGRAPAPPPVDPAKRFGIRFDRASRGDRSRRGAVEGTLDVPGLRVELPLGWWPSAALRSRDGFPILLVDGQGEVAGRIERLTSDDLLMEHGAAEWVDLPGAKSRGAVAWWAGPGGERLIEAREGHGWKLVPEVANPGGWERLVESVVVRRASKRGE